MPRRKKNGWCDRLHEQPELLDAIGGKLRGRKGEEISVLFLS